MNTGIVGRDCYMLPGGPVTGEQVMRDGISFAHAKITNKITTHGAIYTESFHSYLPVICLAPVSDEECADLPNYKPHDVIK